MDEFLIGTIEEFNFKSDILSSRNLTRFLSRQQSSSPLARFTLAQLNCVIIQLNDTNRGGPPAARAPKFPEIHSLRGPLQRAQVASEVLRSEWRELNLLPLFTL